MTQYGEVGRQNRAASDFLGEHFPLAPDAIRAAYGQFWHDTQPSYQSVVEQQLAIKTHFPDVLAVEMEGASVAQAAKVLGKPFVVIRSLSDTADGQAAESFDEFIIQAGEKSAATLIKMLEIMV